MKGLLRGKIQLDPQLRLHALQVAHEGKPLACRVPDRRHQVRKVNDGVEKVQKQIAQRKVVAVSTIRYTPIQSQLKSHLEVVNHHQTHNHRRVCVVENVVVTQVVSEANVELLEARNALRVFDEPRKTGVARARHTEMHHDAAVDVFAVNCYFRWALRRRHNLLILSRHCQRVH